MKVHEAIARALADNGADVVFGLIGDGNLFMVRSFVDDLKGTFVAATQEAGSVMMAAGYATLSGKVGVATVTHGPALTNALTPLVDAAKGRIPLVLLCGDTAVEDRDHLQKIPQREFIVATGAGFEQIRSPQTAVQDVATAFRRARMEQRPIALNMPADFQWLDVTYAAARVKYHDDRSVVPESQDLDDAIGIIAAAKRPIIIAGRGATSPKAKAALLRLGTRIDALLATTLKGSSLFRGEAFNIGVFGTLSTPVASELIAQSDCLIAFGASLNKFTTSSGSLLKGKRLIQCNLEPEEVGKHVNLDAGLVGDPALVADKIIYWLDQAEIPPSGFRSEEIRQSLNAYAPLAQHKDSSTDSTVDLSLALRRINSAVPQDRIFVTDGGRFVGQAWKMIDVFDPQSYVHTLHYGSIGLGMGYAIGAAFAAPGRRILLVTGDGGFMLGGLQEFSTAVRHNLNMIVVICNDGSYGAEHIQFRDRQLDPALSLFKWPEFAEVASAMGGLGLSVRTAKDLERACMEIENARTPLVIDLKLDPDRMLRNAR